MGSPVPAEQGSTRLTVDLTRYAEALTRQRNDALDQAAQWRAVAEGLLAERDQTRAELAALKE
jgi:hypothetical protein